MSYKTMYAHINEMGDRAAWEEARSLDQTLPEEPKTEADLKSALVSLTRRVKELEYEWS